ncbi:hypothetical protein Y032_0414g1034 [Ancylostoma ceylanicum]|uniref:Uncharacterized protein n=1 Tax=Ancylostoma ceylanicum TaxID=53326 RepID=A0A016X1U4_9BILA|nr:hypothetical protein Y032_0414g1034 [Ancylostoma ceylanicum]
MTALDTQDFTYNTAHGCRKPTVAPRSHRHTPSLRDSFLRTIPIIAIWSPFDLSRRDLYDDLLNIGRNFHFLGFSQLIDISIDLS